MLIHCYIIIKCTQTVLLPLAIMGKASTNWSSTPPSLPPHTCQWSLWFREIGGLYCLKEERGQWMLTTDMYFLLWGHTFLWSSFLSQQRSPFLHHPGDTHSVTQRRLQFSEVIKFLKVSCHFSMCDLWVCFMKCIILAEKQEKWAMGTLLLPGLPPGDWDHSPGLWRRPSQDPISPLSAWHFLLPWCVIEETERNLAKRLFLWANLMAE